MKRTVLFLLFLLVSVVLFTSRSATACTGVFAKAEDGSVIYARTLEFAADLESAVIAVPKGYRYTGSTPSGKGGAEWEVKYNILGMNFLSNDLVTDGMNDQGLQGGNFYFANRAKYKEYSAEDEGKAIAPEEFVMWALSRFKSVKELEQHYKDVVIVNTFNKAMGQVIPLHFLFIDKTGDSLVIEVVEEGIFTYKNPVGVFTNNPTFDWHLTNLRNYIGVTPENRNTLKLGGFELLPFGEGTGMFSLPGDSTPPSRFVRAAYKLAAILPFSNGREGLGKMMRLLKDFYLVDGAVTGLADGKKESDITEYEVYKILNEFALYIDVYSNINIKRIDGSKIDFSKDGVQVIKLGGEEYFEDITGTITQKSTGK